MEEIKNKPEETQDGLFIMKWRNFLPMLIAIVMGTNTVSIFYQKQQRHEELIEYNMDRAKRLDENTRHTIEYESTINHLEMEINYLKADLEDCKEKL